MEDVLSLNDLMIDSWACFSNERRDNLDVGDLFLEKVGKFKKIGCFFGHIDVSIYNLIIMTDMVIIDQNFFCFSISLFHDSLNSS